MAKVLFHPEAQAEYDAALLWYQARSLRAAARFEVEMERVVDQIADSPARYPLYDDEHRFALLRRFPFSVVYLPLPLPVYVVAVAHSSRSTGYWQGRVP